VHCNINVAMRYHEFVICASAMPPALPISRLRP
jgi:polysaccharide pyruvyl transferase WcaK-like protein